MTSARQQQEGEGYIVALLRHNRPHPAPCLLHRRGSGRKRGLFSVTHRGPVVYRSIPPSRLQPASLAPPPPRPRAGTTRVTRAETSPPRSRAALAPKPPPTYAPERARSAARVALRSGAASPSAPERHRNRAGAKPLRSDTTTRRSGARLALLRSEIGLRSGAVATRRRSGTDATPERRFARRSGAKIC